MEVIPRAIRVQRGYVLKGLHQASRRWHLGGDLKVEQGLGGEASGTAVFVNTQSGTPTAPSSFRGSRVPGALEEPVGDSAGSTGALVPSCAAGPGEHASICGSLPHRLPGGAWWRCCPGTLHGG